MAERRGRALEELMEVLYRVEASNGGADLVIEKIESPGHVTDKETGSSREFDVLVSGSIGKMPFQLAIECKDWSRPIDAPVVEGFIAKCSGTNVPLRMIVSKSGFGEPALKKAAANGIQCRTLEEVAKLDWLLTDQFTYTERRMTNVHLYGQVAQEVPPDQRAAIVGENGEEITAETQRQLGLSVLQQVAATNDFDEGHHTVKLNVVKLGWQVLRIDDVRVPVEVVTVTVEFDVIKQGIPVQTFLEHVHEEGTAPVAHAVANFPQGQLLISENPDGSKGVRFIPAARL